MANQMIALQARAPQSAGIGNAIQQNAQMINMLTQQRAAERQNALAAQKLQLDLETAQRAQGKEARDIKAADIALAKNQLEYHSKRATAVRTPQGYAAWVEGVRQDSPEMADFFVTNLPPEEFDRDELIKMVAGVEQNFNATFAPVKEDVTYDLQGYKYRSRTGGFEGQGDYPLDEMELDPTGGAPRGSVELGEQTTVEGGQGGPLLPMPEAPSMPGVAPSRMSTDMAGLLTNARNDAEYQQALGLIQRMNSDAAQSLRQIMPVYDAQLMDSVRAEAQAAFGGQAAQPPTNEFPLVAGPRGGPLEGYRPSGRQARGKPLLQSPAPGTNIQTLPRIAGEAGAAEGGKQGVRVRTEPVIAGGTKAAELRAQRDNEFPESKFRFTSNLARIDKMIEKARALRNHPAYTRIIGSIDALTPTVMPGASSALELYKSLMSLGTTESLQEMRAASPTGGAVGNVTDADIQLLKEGFASLGRRQDEADFDKELQGLIQSALNARNRLVTQYRDVYSYRLPKNWTPPPVAKTRPGTPTGQGRKAGEFIVMEPE